MIDVDAERFAGLVDAAFARIPQELVAQLDNVVLFIEDDAPANDPTLLGLYEGVPLTERGDTYSAVLPDRIYVYRHPILAICDTEEDVIREVEITVVHEVAHYFGIDDARLHGMGYA